MIMVTIVAVPAAMPPMPMIEMPFIAVLFPTLWLPIIARAFMFPAPFDPHVITTFPIPVAGYPK